MNTSSGYLMACQAMVMHFIAIDTLYLLPHLLCTWNVCIDAIHICHGSGSHVLETLVVFVPMLHVEVAKFLLPLAH